MKEGNTYRTLFIFTLMVLLVLVAVAVYIFAIKPTIQGYIVNRQVEAGDYIIGTIINQVQQQGYVQLSYMNRTVILIPYQQPAQ